MLTIITLTGQKFILQEGASEYLNITDDGSVVDIRDMDQSIFFCQITDRMWEKIVNFCNTSVEHPEGTGIPTSRKLRTACTDGPPPVADHWWSILEDLTLEECIDEFNYWKMVHLVPGNSFDFANLWELRTAYAISSAVAATASNPEDLDRLRKQLKPLIEKDKAVCGWS